MRNWQSSIVHFAASFRGRIGRPVSSPVMTRPKMSSCLSKRSSQILTLLCFCSSVSSLGTIFAHTFFMSGSSVKIFLTVSLSMFTCSAMLPTVSRRFSRTIWWIFCNVFFSSACCWPSWSLFVSDTFSSLRKTFHTFANCRFLHSTYPRILPITSLWFCFHSFQVSKRNLMFVHCSNSSFDILAAAHQNTRRQ